MRRREGVSELPTTPSKLPKVSVIIPCRNEESNIADAVDSVLSNGYTGDLEVLIVDGMSGPVTLAILERLQETFSEVRVLSNPSIITPVAMNIGIRESTGEICLVMGGHSILGADYIHAMVSRLISDDTVGCVGGQTVSRPRHKGVVAESISASRHSRFGVGNSEYRFASHTVRDVDTVAFGVYRRSVLIQIGMFDEKLLRNQDIELNHRLRRAGYRVLLNPEARVYYTPRASLSAFARQNYANGVWNIKTWTVSPGSLSARHFVPFIFVGSLMMTSVLGVWLISFRILFFLIAGSYMIVSLLETLRTCIRTRRLQVFGLVLVFPVLHVSYGLGLCRGLLATIALKRT